MPAVMIRDLAWILHLHENLTPDADWSEIAVIHHADCGLALFARNELRHGYVARGRLGRQDGPADGRARPAGTTLRSRVPLQRFSRRRATTSGLAATPTTCTPGRPAALVADAWLEVVGDELVDELPGNRCSSQRAVDDWPA